MDSDSNLGSLSVEDNSSSSSRGMMVPIAIALTGVVLGGIALYMALAGSDKSTETQSAIDEANQQTIALEQKLAEVEQQLSSLTTEYEAQERQLRTLASQTQSALDQVGREMTATRQQTTATAEKVQEMVEKLSKPISAPVAAQAPTTQATDRSTSQPLGNAPGTGPSGSVSPSHRHHVIASGETFAKLSSMYDVSVDSILAANPDTDPRRLQVGQKIKIPHSAHSRE